MEHERIQHWVPGGTRARLAEVAAREGMATGELFRHIVRSALEKLDRKHREPEPALDAPEPAQPMDRRYRDARNDVAEQVKNITKRNRK